VCAISIRSFPDIRNSRRARYSLRVAWFDNFAMGVAPFVLRGLMSTCRLSVQNERWFRLARREAVVGAVWHQHLPVYAWAFRGTGFIVLASRSRDGELAARLAQRFGIGSVRGSSSRGGHEALLEMIGRIRRGRTAAFVADGPRGPAHVAKMGMVIAARETGRPIQPVATAISRCARARSWDRTEMPLPGSRIIVRFAEPIPVPAGASREDCERLRQRAQDVLLATEAEARASL